MQGVDRNLRHYGGMVSRLRLTVTGIGYLGLTHAACMADLGHEVLAIDVDRERVAKAVAGVEAVEGADLVPHLMEREEYRAIDPSALAVSVAEPRIIDARCVLDAGIWESGEWSVWAHGRSLSLKAYLVSYVDKHVLQAK